MPIIEGNRIVLEPIEEKHAEIFLREVNSSRSFLDAKLPWVRAMNTIEDALRFIDSYTLQSEMDNGGLWGLFEKENRTFLGCICLQWIQWDNLSASIGYWLLKSHTGKGYATEALKMICSYAFNSLKLNRLEIDIAANNLKSIALVKGVGFQEEGFFREYANLHGIFLNHLRFSLLSTDPSHLKL